MESQGKHCKTAFKTEKCGRPLTTDQMGGTTLINQSLSELIKPLKYWITFNTPMKIKERTGFKKVSVISFRNRGFINVQSCNRNIFSDSNLIFLLVIW